MWLGTRELFWILPKNETEGYRVQVTVELSILNKITIKKIHDYVHLNLKDLISFYAVAKHMAWI